MEQLEKNNNQFLTKQSDTFKCLINYFYTTTICWKKADGNIYPFIYNGGNRLTDCSAEVLTELAELAADLGLADLEEMAIYYYNQWRGW